MDDTTRGDAGPDVPKTAAESAADATTSSAEQGRRRRRRHHDDAEHHEVTGAEIDQAAALAGARVEHFVEELIEAELATGKREETLEAAKRHIVVRVVRVSAGVIVLILGLAMLALPGPGLVVIALGLGLLAQDVPFARNLLAKVRSRLPQDENGKLPRSTIVTMVLVTTVAVGLSIWFTVRSLSG